MGLTKKQKQMLSIIRARELIDTRGQHTAPVETTRQGVQELKRTAIDTVKGLGSGIPRGAAQLADLPSTLSKLVVAGGIKGANLAGVDTPVSASEFLSAADDISKGTGAQGLLERAAPSVAGFMPETIPGKLAQSTGEFLSGKAFGGPALPLVLGGVASETGGLLTEGTPLELPARIGGGLIGGGVGARGLGVRAQRAARGEFIHNTPSSKQLDEAANALYQQGHALNLKIRPVATKTLESELRAFLKAEGQIFADGTITSKGGIKNILKSLHALTKNPATTKEMQGFKSLLNDLAGNKKPNLARIGVLLKHKYNKFFDARVPFFKEANELKRRAMLGEIGDRADELADVRAAQFTQSGRDNALRAEFAELDRAVIKGNLKGLRPDQVQALKDASRGTRPIRAARAVGRLAPKGANSLMATLAVGGAAGAATLNPAIGILTGLGLGGTTLGANALSNLLRSRASSMAGAALRSKTPMVLPRKPSGVGAGILGAILGAR